MTFRATDPPVPVPHGVYAANAVLAMKDGHDALGHGDNDREQGRPMQAVTIALTETLPAAVAGEMPRKAKAGTTLTPRSPG